LLDRPIGIDHDNRALSDSQSFRHSRLAEYELDELAKQADLRFLAWRGIPPVKDADQPVRIATTRRRRTPIGMREQQIESRRVEFEQRLIGGDGVVASVDHAEDSAIAVAELW
jgi:hypothetical protein